MDEVTYITAVLLKKFNIKHDSPGLKVEGMEIKSEA